MRKQWFAITITVATATTALLVLFWLMGDISSGISTPALAAPLSLTVTAVDPAVAPNDIDTPIVIQGTGFTATLSGTEVITAPTVYLGDEGLTDVTWVDTTTLSATVPWGLIPDIYPLTVVNPDGISATLQSAFTVTEGFGVFTTDGPYGGDLVDIQKKPGTPTTVFALCSGVGLFVSEDSGGEWELVYSVDWMTSLAFDSQDTDVMYLGTWRADEFARSMDGGQTWEIVPQICEPENGTYRSYPATYPTAEPGEVFVGVGHPQGELLPGEGGVFCSDDYGATWITKTNGMTDTDVQSIAIHPNAPDKMLAGTWDGNLYVSTDGGENWSLEAHLDGPVFTVYFNPYQPLEAWATAGTLVNNVPYLYKSTDLTTWTPVVVDASLTCGERWDLDFLPGETWATSVKVYSSTNNGVSWTNVYTGANVIAITPDNPQEIYAAAGRGIRKSSDRGQSWQDVNEGLAGMVPYLIATTTADPDIFYVKTGQSIFRSFNGGYAWQDLDYGNGGYPAGDYLAIDPYTTTRIYLGANIQCNDVFCVEISMDVGETWTLVTSTLPLTYAGWDSSSFAVAPHPQVPGRILVGNTASPPASAPWLGDATGMVYASDDYGQTWAHLGPSQPISIVLDIAYDAVDPNLVYMATEGSGLWKSTDGGTTWNVTSFGGNNRLHEIATHPTLSGHLIIAGNDDVNGTGLFLSQDAGESWTFLGNNVQGPVVYVPTFSPILYSYVRSSQQNGLVRSTDNGQTWELIEGAPIPTRLATATDGERVVLYIGSAGGLASQAALSSNAVLGQSTILGGGVYRLTTRLPTDWVYLPLVVRGYAP